MKKKKSAKEKKNKLVRKPAAETIVIEKKKIIPSSLKETFLLIINNKLLILALFILQIIFFSVLTVVQINYNVVIAGNLQSMSQYLDNMNLDDEIVAEKMAQKEEILDMSQIYNNYDVIIKTLKTLVIVTFLLFAVFNGINWAFTDYIIKRKSTKEFFMYLWKFILLTLLYGSLILVLILAFIKLSFADLMAENGTGFSIIFFILVFVVLYFMFISFALVGRADLKDIFKKTFLIGTKKAHIVFLAYLVNLAVVDSLFFILYFAVDMAFWLLLVVTLLFFFSFILARVFLLVVVDNINKEIS